MQFRDLTKIWNLWMRRYSKKNLRKRFNFIENSFRFYFGFFANLFNRLNWLIISKPVDFMFPYYLLFKLQINFPHIFAHLKYFPFILILFSTLLFHLHWQILTFNILTFNRNKKFVCLWFAILDFLH